jgi:outer membrane protein assembly factor BamB
MAGRAMAMAVALGVLGVLHAEGRPSGIQPVRAQPSVKTAITAGFRDWGPATLAGDTIIGTNMTGRGGVFAFDAATGRRRWVQTITRTTDLERDYAVRGLVQAGEVIVGMTSLALIAFDPASGRVAWELPGKYRDQVPTLAAADGVLYFEGSPTVRPAASTTGTLHALDLGTRELLWSFTRPAEEPNWPFGHLLPVDGGLWVDSHKTLLKLQ